MSLQIDSTDFYCTNIYRHSRITAPSQISGLSHSSLIRGTAQGSGLTPLSTSLCRFYFLFISTVFPLMFCDMMSAKWRTIDEVPKSLPSLQTPIEVVSNTIIFDWHVFITSIFLRINGLLIVRSLLSVM